MKGKKKKKKINRTSGTWNGTTCFHGICWATEHTKAYFYHRKMTIKVSWRDLLRGKITLAPLSILLIDNKTGEPSIHPIDGLPQEIKEPLIKVK